MEVRTENEMERIARKLYYTICNMEGTLIIERATLDNGFCHFITFKNEKGYWTVWSNQLLLGDGDGLCLHMFHMSVPIYFAMAESDKSSFNKAFCELCRKSPHLLGNYSVEFAVEELPIFIECA